MSREKVQRRKGYLPESCCQNSETSTTNVELKGKFERLQADYGQVQKANSRLSERLQEVKLENKSLRRNSADYAQLKQILGAEQIEATLNAAKRLKQSEKGCKQPQRSVDHGVR